jgi:hypothetical protein
VNVAVGLSIIVVSFVGFSPLARRWGGAAESLRSSFMFAFILCAVGFGVFMGGISYAEYGSVRQALLSTLILGPAFGVLMTAIFTVPIAYLRLFRPRRYEFFKAWVGAHRERGARTSGDLRAGQRRHAVMLRFRDQWEREEPAITATEFILVHWEEVVVAEAAAG